MYWDTVLKEVLNKQSPRYSFIFTTITENTTVAETASEKYKKSHYQPPKTYFLGDNYKGIYFTRREAECLVHLLQGKTIKSTAHSLNLSARTVEF